ncbi:MAG: hypothetical protein ACI4PX_00050 [Ruminococcus sp.]|nr:hypothetical protein [Oscillospiraceae bacterium]
MSENINVDEIVNQIRAEIKEKGLEPSMLSFEDVPFDKEVSHTETHFELSSLVQSADYMNARNQIEPYKEISGNPISVFIKKVIRKLVKFYIMPIMTEQNALNYHCANAINQVSCYVQDNSKIDVVQLASKVDELELRLTATKLETDSLRTQVKVLKAENARLKKNQEGQK